MATQDFAASVQGVAIRVTRLDAAGNLLNNPGDSYTTSAFLRASFTPEYEEGEEIITKAANGTICVSYKGPDTLKKITFQLAICEPDAELTSLLSGGVLLRKNYGTFAAPNRLSVGWGSPEIGDKGAGNGVALEVWSYAIKGGKRLSTNPYFYWIFPYVVLRSSGDRVIENGLLANTFEGYGLGNVTFGSGPDGRWEFPITSERPYSYARSTFAPVGLQGFYTWHADSTKALSNKSLTSNVATLTTTTAHGFVVGEQVTVTAVDTVFNGTFTITSVPSTTTLTYALTNTDVVSASTTGPIVRIAGSTAVNDFLLQGSTTAYNVPGSIDYVPTSPNDFILASTQDPTS